VLIDPHFQQVNHFHSAPMKDCAPQLVQVATNCLPRPSASPLDDAEPLPAPPSPSGCPGPSHFPQLFSSAISFPFLPVLSLSFRFDDQMLDNFIALRDNFLRIERN
jgi:hypothetical protein